MSFTYLLLWKAKSRQVASHIFIDGKGHCNTGSVIYFHSLSSPALLLSLPTRSNTLQQALAGHKGWESSSQKGRAWDLLSAAPFMALCSPPGQPTRIFTASRGHRGLGKTLQPATYTGSCSFLTIHWCFFANFLSLCTEVLLTAY